MIKYGYEGLELLKQKIDSNELKELGRNKPTDFTRERKMGFTNLIYYNLNKKGLCTNMEINNFFEKIDKNITLAGQSLLDQRLKLNPDVFIELNKSYLQPFYVEYRQDVKTYKGYILKAIDGSDFEIPNTQKSKNTYRWSKKQNH